jgi:hypothetical protein
VCVCVHRKTKEGRQEILHNRKQQKISLLLLRLIIIVYISFRFD